MSPRTRSAVNTLCATLLVVSITLGVVCVACEIERNRKPTPTEQLLTEIRDQLRQLNRARPIQL
jgi:hypothetical protein